MVQQDIFDYIELSKITKIPILLFSNPGYGKTTSINMYASKKGYHVESLIGSRFSPDDIMGYQVNEPGRETLIQKDPVWYQRIIENEKNGIHSILFLDEISTCSDQVQGSLLSLIFDRKIGNGKELPDSCVVISAANYSENLPGFMNIMSPTINRFCVINLLNGYNNVDILKEFLTKNEASERIEKDVNKEDIYQKYYDMFSRVMLKYSDVNSSSGYIDLNNKNLEGVYKRGNEVYNFISGRTLNYLRDMVWAMAKLGITNISTIENVVGGLVGLGSNSFKSEEQIVNFIRLVSKEILGIITSSTANSSTITFEKDCSISREVNKYLNSLEEKTLTDVNYEDSLTDLISERYGDFEKTYQKLNDGSLDGMEFVNDMDTIALLIPRVASNNASIIANIRQSYSSMYSDIVGISEEFNKNVYGVFTPNIVKRVLVASTKTNSFVRVGVFGQSGNSYVVIPNGVNVCDATLSRIIASNQFTELKVTKK